MEIGTIDQWNIDHTNAVITNLYNDVLRDINFDNVLTDAASIEGSEFLLKLKSNNLGKKLSKHVLGADCKQWLKILATDPYWHSQIEAADFETENLCIDPLSVIAIGLMVNLTLLNITTSITIDEQGSKKVKKRAFSIEEVKKLLDVTKSAIDKSMSE